MSSCLFNLYAEYIMQNDRLGESQAGIKIAGRNINNLDMQMKPSNGRNWRGTKEPLDIGLKVVSEKTGLKLNFQKTKIMAIAPITSWQIDGKKWRQWHILFSLATKSLWMVTAAMELEDASSLEGKLWPT